MSTEKRNENFMLKQSRYSKGKKNVKQYSKNNASKKSGSGKNSYNAYYKKNDDGFQPKSNGKSNYGKKKYPSKSKGYPKKNAQKPSIKIAFLGGLNEIGKNITLVECENDIIIIDCGMAFPDGDMLGVDLVIPDFTYIEQNADRVKGIILTHGHEDHIGGLPFYVYVSTWFSYVLLRLKGYTNPGQAAPDDSPDTETQAEIVYFKTQTICSCS